MDRLSSGCYGSRRQPSGPFGAYPTWRWNPPGPLTTTHVFGAAFEATGTSIATAPATATSDSASFLFI
jgi:hypothetical protein